jgi:hypothetical protein
MWYRYYVIISSILTSIKIINHFKCTDCMTATEANDCSGNWPMNNFMKVIIGHQIFIKPLRNKDNSFPGG